MISPKVLRKEKKKANILHVLIRNAQLTSWCGGAQQSIQDDGEQQQRGSSEHDACLVRVRLVSPNWGGAILLGLEHTCVVSAYTHVVKWHTIWKYIGRPGWVKRESHWEITWTPDCSPQAPEPPANSVWTSRGSSLRFFVCYNEILFGAFPRFLFSLFPFLWIDTILVTIHAFLDQNMIYNYKGSSEWMKSFACLVNSGLCNIS